eukprot:3660897-Pleurochrysis_carterae.AAC.1
MEQARSRRTRQLRSWRNANVLNLRVRIPPAQLSVALLDALPRPQPLALPFHGVLLSLSPSPL